MRLQTSCELAFQVALPTPFILMLRPRGGSVQTVISEEYRLTPAVPMLEFNDTYGNLCQRLVAPVGQFEVSTSATVVVADQLDTAPGAAYVSVPDLPDEVLRYLLPSRYCESDRFGQLASQITADQRPGYDQVAAIEAWLRQTVRYAPGSSEIPLSAVEVNQNQFGVCRDLAHLGIALCRGLCIPARLVVGYLYQLDPMDLHAWFEAYVGGQWYTFDATQNRSQDTVTNQITGGYVAIGYGRDAADVAIYNQFGPPVFPLKQEVLVRRVEDD